MTAASPPRAERSPTALTVRGLRKAFGPKVAVAGIDLDIPHGCFFGLVGQRRGLARPFLACEQERVLPWWSRTVLDHLVAEPVPFGRAGLARDYRCPLASRGPGSLTARALAIWPGR